MASIDSQARGGLRCKRCTVAAWQTPRIPPRTAGINARSIPRLAACKTLASSQASPLVLAP